MSTAVLLMHFWRVFLRKAMALFLIARGCILM